LGEAHAIGWRAVEPVPMVPLPAVAANPIAPSDVLDTPETDQ